MAAILTGNQLLVAFGLLLFFVSPPSSSEAFNLLPFLEQQGKVLEQVLNVNGGNSGKGTNTGVQLQDPLHLPELLKQLDSFQNTFQNYEEGDMSCTLINSVGDDCILSFKVAKAKDIAIEVLQNLSNYQGPLAFLHGIVTAVIQNPCTCASREISGGCHDLFKKGSDALNSACSAKANLDKVGMILKKQ